MKRFLPQSLPLELCSFLDVSMRNDSAGTTSFDSFLKHINNFKSLFDTLNIEYINKITGTLSIPKNTNYYLIRDSINFRFSSILFHLRLLQYVQLSQYKQINKEKNKQLAMHNHDFEFFDQQFQLFDSIIFHIVSLFDYLGNLIGLICINKTKLKWDGIMNSIKDTNNSFSRLEISFILKNIDNELVDKLYNYRSELIHYSKASGGFRASYDLIHNEMKFKVLTPKKVCKRFKELKLLHEKKDISINYALFWMVDKTIKNQL